MKDGCSGSINHDKSREEVIFGGGGFCFTASQLGEVKPLRLEEVSRTPQGRQWDQLARQYHYLGYRKLVGKHLKYLMYSCRGELLAATGWNSPVWKLKARDLAIGWSPAERSRLLDRVANNSRFVIFPWVARIPNLASHLLSRQVQRVREDWPEKSGSIPPI